jgi:hypothetical protein
VVEREGEEGLRLWLLGRGVRRHCSLDVAHYVGLFCVHC